MPHSELYFQCKYLLISPVGNFYLGQVGSFLLFFGLKTGPFPPNIQVKILNTAGIHLSPLSSAEDPNSEPHVVWQALYPLRRLLSLTLGRI